MTLLRGLAWNHTRGYVPVVATAQRFEDLGYGEIRWEKRSLTDFGDQDLAQLAFEFDILLIDHPHVGRLASLDLLEPLDHHLDGKLLGDLRENSVGKSFDSYWFENNLWAVPVDAAAPVSSWRPDLIHAAGIDLPETWSQLCELAHRGLVIIPATPVDALMHFYMLCCGAGEEPFGNGRLVSADVAFKALRLLRELIQLCPAECLQRDPIQTYREW